MHSEEYYNQLAERHKGYINKVCFINAIYHLSKRNCIGVNIDTLTGVIYTKDGQPIEKFRRV